MSADGIGGVKKPDVPVTVGQGEDTGTAVGAKGHDDAPADQPVTRLLRGDHADAMLARQPAHPGVPGEFNAPDHPHSPAGADNSLPAGSPAEQPPTGSESASEARDRVILARDATIAQRDATIAQRDRTIDELRQASEAKDRQIAELNRALSGRNDLIDEQRRNLGAKDSENEKLKSENADLKVEICLRTSGSNWRHSRDIRLREAKTKRPWRVLVIGRCQRQASQEMWQRSKSG